MADDRTSSRNKSFAAQYETSPCKFMHIWAIYLLKQIVFIYNTIFELKVSKLIIWEW